MTFAVPNPLGDDVDADARFAAFLADAAAHVDDPERGEGCRAVLSEVPQTQRALFDLGEAMASGTATLTPLSMLVASAATLVLVIAAFVFTLRVIA